MPTVPTYKIIATVCGIALTSAAVWMNAEHVAHAEGSFSPLVLASVIFTLCAASAPPFAERAWHSGEYAKSLFTSISRSSEYAGGKAAGVDAANEARELAKEAYEAAKKSAADECAKRGPEVPGRRDKA